MNADDIKTGHWYMIDEYGFSEGVKGKVVDVCGQYVTIKFYWGAPFRTRQVVKIERIVSECCPPAFFSNH